MFTEAEREVLRARLIELARADSRISGGAITGSASVGNEDRWSDIDLAFGVREPLDVESTLESFGAWMYKNSGAVQHLDVPSGAWIYRVFLLPSTLQVDLAFAPASDFGARAPTFRLVFGSAAELPHVSSPTADSLIGWAWLYALHARSSIARDKPWQAEYMISGMRDQVLALACLRYDLPSREGRGVDRLPSEVLGPLQEALVRHLDADELRRAFRAAAAALLSEVDCVDRILAARLQPILRDLTGV